MTATLTPFCPAQSKAVEASRRIYSDFHPAAKQEQLDLLARFEAVTPETAQRFQDRIDHALTRIGQMPKLYREQIRGVRIVSLIPHFSEYFIAYTIWNGVVVILPIGHAKRNPFHFIDRINDTEAAPRLKKIRNNNPQISEHTSPLGGTRRLSYHPASAASAQNHQLASKASTPGSGTGCRRT